MLECLVTILKMISTGWSRFREFAAPFYPPVGYLTAFISALLSLIVMLVSSCPYFATLQPGREGTFLDALTYGADPLLAHLLGILCVAVLVSYHLKPTVKSRLARMIFAMILPSVAVILTLLITEFILKPSFAIERPIRHLTSPWIMGILQVDSPGKADSAPSGRITCQLFLFFLGLAYYPPLFHSRVRKANGASIVEHGAILILFLSVILVSFARVYRGFHTVLDVGLAVGSCAYLFWLLFAFVGRLLQRSHESAIAGITAATCIFLPFFFFFSRDAEWWGWILMAVVWLLGLAHLSTTKRKRMERSA